MRAYPDEQTIEPRQQQQQQQQHIWNGMSIYFGHGLLIFFQGFGIYLVEFIKFINWYLRKQFGGWKYIFFWRNRYELLIGNSRCPHFFMDIFFWEETGQIWNLNRKYIINSCMYWIAGKSLGFVGFPNNLIVKRKSNEKKRKKCGRQTCMPVLGVPPNHHHSLSFQSQKYVCINLRT